MKKLIPFLTFFIFIHCSSGSSNSTNEEIKTSNSVQSSYFCDEVQEALNNVYLAYSKVEAESFPSPATLDSFLDWPVLFNKTLKENPAYNNIITSVSKFDELINNKPDCLDKLEQ